MQHTLYIRTYEVKINKCDISSLWWHTSAPYTCKIYYFNMQHNYINMHMINFCQFFFLRVNFLTNAIIWHYIHATCNIIMFTMRLIYVNMRLIYVIMQHYYVNMRLIYVDMQHNYVNMRLIYVDMQHYYVHMRLFAYWHR